MSPSLFVAVFTGAGLGAVLRWALGIWLNAIVWWLPLGTLAANLGGGLLIGLAGAFFLHNNTLPPEWRLLVITGFLGGLTTFSTFSFEVVSLLQRGEPGYALLTAAVHLAGSLLLTGAGLWLGHALFVRG